MYRCETLADVYRIVGKELLENGKTVSPRGKETKELLMQQIMIENPRARIAHHHDRKFSTIFALIESIMLFEEFNRVVAYSLFNDNISQFSDNGVTFYGDYGGRVAHYIPKVIEKLREDPETRQAYIPIFDRKDMMNETLDTPCTMGLNFIIRDGKLNLSVTMRSNDIIWGLPYDIFNFTMLQEIVANSLNMKMGWYMHTATSLHVYEKHYDLLKKLVDEGMTTKQFVLNCDYEDWKMLSSSYVRFIEKRYDVKEMTVLASLQHTHTSPFSNFIIKKYHERMAKKISYDDTISFYTPKSTKKR